MKEGVNNENKHQPHLASQLRTLGDAELGAALLNGCNDALAILFERYSRLVFRIALNLVRDEGEAEETVQQVFFDVFRAIRQFRPERASFKTWLLQFAYHRSINRRQHLLAKRFYNSEELNEETLTQVPGSSQYALKFGPLEANHLISQVLATVKPRQRRVIELTYFEGLTPEEIALRLGRKASNVRHDLYRGLFRLRHVLLEPCQTGRDIGPTCEMSTCRLYYTSR